MSEDYIIDKKATFALPKKVLRAEYDEISLRRSGPHELNKGDDTAGEPGADGEARTARADDEDLGVFSTKLGLVGLALSGGGIRSATFNLGIIQVLAEHGVLKAVDYLSTVSGGGYIGSCLSSILNDDRSDTDEQFPLKHKKGEEEPPAFRHLRNSGNYLIPTGGLVETLRIPGILFRGILLNFLAIWPYLMLAILPAWPVLKLWDHFDHVILPFLPAMIFAAAYLGRVLLFPIKSAKLNSWKIKERELYGRAFGRFLTLALLLGAWGASLHLIRAYSEALNRGSSIDDWVLGLTAGGPATYLLLTKALRAADKLPGQVLLWFLALLAPAILFLVYLQMAAWLIYRSPSAWAVALLLLITVLIWAYTSLKLDINQTSMHSFYRDRLSEAYLFKCKPEGDKGQDPAARDADLVESNDSQKLSDLNRRRAAPYHLINVTLNLQGEEDPELLRGRRSDFFTFSQKFVGSPRTSYQPTTELEERDEHLDLGTAMAISGAAAAPNMGALTIRPLVMLMTLFNIRLGYWTPNPAKLGGSRPWWAFFRNNPGPLVLIKELLGRLNDKGYYLNVSDGGHLENTGAYELLRRRCKFIIIGDGEADPEMELNGLATLIRYARIDMGIDIEIDLDELRKDEEGLSRRHCALGKIQYGGGEVGYLLYVKSSLTGDENEYVHNYRMKHPSFPHQTTADQFFDESQFEVYRALGAHIMNALLRMRRYDPANGRAEIRNWYAGLDDLLQPQYRMEQEFVDLAAQFTEIEKALQGPEMADYTYQLYPELGRGQDPAGPAPSDESFRNVLHVCNRQLQLMENVYLALDFHEASERERPLNRGWMNLFRRWAQAPDFRRAWAVSIGAYSRGFQAFCEHVLGLTLSVRCVDANGAETGLSDKERRTLAKAKERGTYRPETDADKTDAGAQPDRLWLGRLSTGVADEENGFVFCFATTRFSREKEEGSESEVECVTIKTLYIRDYFRKMNLLERFLLELKPELVRQFGEHARLRVECATEEARKSYKYFYESLGFEAVPR